jgi:hypothetical protein
METLSGTTNTNIWSKAFLLIALSLTFCFVTPLSLLASSPLSVAILSFGRAKALLLASTVFILMGFIAYRFPEFIGVLVLFVGALIMANLITSFIYRKMSPAKVLLYSGSIFLILTGLSFFAYQKTQTTSIKENIEQVVIVWSESVKSKMIDQGGEKTRELEDWLSKPKDLAHEIFTWLPTYFFIATFLSLWVGLFLTLRNSLIWRKSVDYPFTLKDLLKFKTPEYLVYPLLLALGVFAAAQLEMIKHPMLDVSVRSFLSCLAVFYFFQGYGIFLELLAKLKVMGFMKSLMIAFTLILLWQAIVLIGVLDLWVDFRTKFNKLEKNEGDKL